MTSQKRFRHQENSNSGNRTRDLPPRFKRQKSSSTPPDPRAASPPTSLIEKSNHADNMTKRSQIQTSTGTSMSRGSPSPNSPPHSVLRPVNYRYSDIPSTVPQQVFQPIPSHQMWTPNGYTGLQPVMVSPSPVMLPQTVTQVGQHPVDSTSYYNENCAPSPSFYMPQCSPMSPWSTSGYGSPYHSSCSSPAPTISSPAPDSEQAKSPQPAAERIKSAGSPGAQYTDPDLRTIEMLRELERVADKESQEAEDGGSDRKTLVSHHLRMLMCAMDRYTENIDNEMDGNTRNDDGISTHDSKTSSPSHSPAPLPRNALVEAQKKVSKRNEEEMRPAFYHVKQMPEPQVLRPVLGVHSGPPTMQQRPHQPRHQAGTFHRTFSGPYSQDPRRPMTQGFPPNQQQSTEWNPWSGQSFDFGGVLGSCLGGPNEYFETFQDTCFPANKERKPLYKR